MVRKTITITLSLLLAAAVAVPAWAGGFDGVLSVDAVIKRLTPDVYSKEIIRRYHRSIQDRFAEGAGTVVEVKEGGDSKVLVLTPASKPEKGYNVVLILKGMSEVPIEPGDEIAFEGEIGHYSIYKGVSVDIIGEFRK